MIQIDKEALIAFENQLNPAYPDQSGIVPTILGYGEISSTFCFDAMPDIAFKRMPPFSGPKAIEDYEKAIATYCLRLSEGSGIRVSEYAIFKMVNRHNEQIVYVAQPRLDADSIGNVRVRESSPEDTDRIIATAADRLIRVGRFNAEHAPDEAIGIDGQISNWSFSREDAEPVYFDITTPFLRIGGKEQLDTEIFLKSCPPYLVWLVRWQFLQEVLDRYYDTRLVLIDLAANLYKEGCADKIPAAIEVINATLEETGAAGSISYLNGAEVEKYYKNDAFIWSLFLTLRRMDRYIKTRMLGRRYNFILPGKIRR